jgi:hypothetical protein
MSFHNTKHKSLTNSSDAERHDTHGDRWHAFLRDIVLFASHGACIKINMN